MHFARYVSKHQLEGKPYTGVYHSPLLLRLLRKELRGLYLYSVAMFAIVKPILLYGDRSRENSVGVHHLVVTNGLEVKQ